jgi:hypothetical protein
MGSASIVNVQISGSDGAQIQFNLDDVKNEDGSCVQFTLQFSKADFYNWLSAHEAGTVKDYLKELIKVVVDRYLATQQVLAGLLGTKVEW